MHAVGQQRRRKGVSRLAPIRAAVEGERQRPAMINQPTLRQTPTIFSHVGWVKRSADPTDISNVCWVSLPLDPTYKVQQSSMVWRPHSVRWLA
jgi:hypothetical protein